MKDGFFKMGDSDDIKLKYKQHKNIKGLGLSVITIADSLINLFQNAEEKAKESNLNPILKLCYGTIYYKLSKILTNPQDIKTEFKNYQKLKKSAKETKNPIKRIKLKLKLDKERKKFAGNLKNPYQALRSQLFSINGAMGGYLQKIDTQSDNERKSMLADLEKDYNVKGVGKLSLDKIKLYLKQMGNLSGGFVVSNAAVISQIERDLALIINQKIKVTYSDSEEEVEKEKEKMIISGPPTK